MKPSESNTAAYAGEVSRIGQSVVISGDISSRSDIRIDGQMEGKLYSEGRVVIGETAKIKEDTTYLTLGITLPKADFTTEQTRLTAIQDLTPKQTDPTILLLTGSSDGTSITITLDSQYHRIIYTIHQQKIK